MSDLRRAFDQAAEDIRQPGARPDNATLLKPCALYKQGLLGNLRGTPGFFDVVGNAQHEAWAQWNGLTERDAMDRYIALVRELLG